MKIVNVLEDIKAEDVVSVKMVGICTECEEFENKEKSPALKVIMKNGEYYIHQLINGFQIHECNNFLNSLNLIDEKLGYIEFHSYQRYGTTVDFINNLISIKLLAEQITGKEYDCIGLKAYEIFSYILSELFLKHGMGTMLWEDVMKIRPIEEWVSEAIADLT